MQHEKKTTTLYLDKYKRHREINLWTCTKTVEE